MSAEMFGGGGQNVNVNFTADSTGYTASLGEMIATTEQYSKVTDGAIGLMSKMSLSMVKLTGTLTGQNRAMMSPAVQQAAAVEQAMSGLEARSKTAGQNFTKIGESVREMAREMPIGLGASIEQFETVQRAGKGTEEQLTNLAKATLEIGAASGDMSGGLTEGLIQFQKLTGGLQVDKLKDMGDALVSVNAEMGTTAQGTLSFAESFAPMADSLGMTQTQVMGLSSAFEKSGVSGRSSITAMNQILDGMHRSMRDGGREFEIYADAVGMTNEEFKNLMESDSTEAAIKFFEAVGNGVEGERTLSKLNFGTRTQQSIRQVAAGGNLRESIAATQRGYGSGAAAEAADTSFSGLNDTIQKTNESLSQLSEAAGRPLIGAFQTLAGITEKVSGGLAGFLNTESGQNIMGGLAIAGGVGSAGLSVASGLITAGGIGAMIPKNVGGAAMGAIGKYKKPLMLGGIGGLAMGATSGNPLMTGLGGAALAATMIPGLADKAKTVGKWGLMNLVANPMADTQDKFFGGKSANYVESMARGKVNDSLKNMGIKGDAYKVDEKWRGYAGNASKYAKEVEKIDKQFKSGGITMAEAEQKLGAAKKAAAPTFGSAGKQSLYNMGGMAGGVLSLLGPGMKAMLPFLGAGALGVGAIGVGAMGYKKWKDEDNRLEDFAGDSSKSLVNLLSEKLGIAAASTDGFNESLTSATKSAKTYTDAYEISAKELTAAKSDELDIRKEYENAKFFEDGNQKALDFMVKTTTAGQSPELTQAAIANLADAADMNAEAATSMAQRLSQAGELGNTSEQRKERTRELFTEMGTKDRSAYFDEEGKLIATGGAKSTGRDGGGYQPGYVEGPLGTAKPNEQLIDFEANNKFDTGLSRDDQLAMAKSLGQSLASGWDKTAETKGVASAAREKSDDLRTVLEDFAYTQDIINSGEGSNRAGRKQNERTLVSVLTAAGYDESAAEDITEEAAQIRYDLLRGDINREEATSQYGAFIDRQVGDLDLVAQEEQNKRDALLTKWGGVQTTDAKDAAMRPELGYGEDYTAAQRKAAAMARWASDNNVELSELASSLGSERNENGEIVVQGDGGDVVVPQQFANDLAAQRNFQATQLPEGPYAEQAVMAETNAGAAPAAIAAREFKDLGEAQAGSPEADMAQRRMTQAIAVMDQNAKSLTSTAGAMEKIGVFAEGAERARSGTSTPEQEAGDQIALQQVTQAEDVIIANAKAQIMAQYNYEKQAGRMTEDFHQAQEWALEDHEQQKTWMIEDHATQRERVLRNYHKQVEFQEQQFYQQREWQQEDFERNMDRRQEDFDLQRDRAEKDRNKNLARQEEDFGLGRIRAAEDLSKSMFDVYKRRQYSSVTSFGSVLGNMKEQNRDLGKQMEIISGLKARGLSQAAIDGLGLADPKNIDQALYWGSSAISDEDIGEMNAQWQTRNALAGQAYDQSTSGRRAREDFIKQRDREAFDWAEGRERELEDYFRDSDRMWEDHIRNRKRQKKVFKQQQKFQRDQLRDSLRDSNQDLAKALSRADTRFEKSMSRMRINLNKSLKRMKRDMKDSMKELTLTASEAMDVVSGDISTKSSNWAGNMRSNLDVMEGDQADSWDRSKGIHSSSLKTIYTWYKDFAKDGKYNGADNTTPPGKPKKGKSNSGGVGASGKASAGSGAPGPHVGGDNYGDGPGTPTFTEGDHRSGQEGSVNWGSTNETLDTILKNFQDLQSTLADYYGGFGFGEGDSDKVLIDGGSPSGKTSFKAANFIYSNWPIDEIGGSRASDPYPGHPSGRAIDVMIPNYNSERGIAMGDEIVDWAQSNVDPLDLYYLIWRQRIWRPGRGWSMMGDRGGDTANHMDHVHLEWNTRGGDGGRFSGGRPTGPMAPDYTDEDGLWSLIDKNARERDLNEDNIGDFTGKKLKPRSSAGMGVVKGDWAYPLPQSVRVHQPNYHHSNKIAQDITADRGTPIYSAHAGTVTLLAGGVYNTGSRYNYNADNGGAGNYLEVSGGGWKNRYLHMRELSMGDAFAPGIKQGSSVAAGQHIGYIGSTGASSGPHLHWDTFEGGERRWPLKVLSEAGAPWKALALGGVVTGETRALIGEAGDNEAVIPLNKQGVEVIAEAIGRYSHSFEAKAAQTAPYAQQVTNTTTINDHSTNVHGPITVESNSVNELMGEIRTKSRMSRLSSPVGDHG